MVEYHLRLVKGLKTTYMIHRIYSSRIEPLKPIDLRSQPIISYITLHIQKGRIKPQNGRSTPKIQFAIKKRDRELISRF